MNEIANYCEKVGADVDMVRRGMGTDSRIGKRFLFSGIGYGGSCFPKDVKALHNSGIQDNYNFKILESVIAVNSRQKTALIPKIESHFDKKIKGKQFAVWGLSFKPETDDIREAPSLDIIQNLLDLGAKIKVYDPEAMDNVAKKFEGKIDFGESLYDTLDNADALVICTEWSIFRTPDFSKVKQHMKGNVIFDGRNLYDLDEMIKEKLNYYSIGRKAITI